MQLDLSVIPVNPTCHVVLGQNQIQAVKCDSPLLTAPEQTNKQREMRLRGCLAADVFVFSYSVLIIFCQAIEV